MRHGANFGFRVKPDASAIWVRNEARLLDFQFAVLNYRERNE